MEAEKRNYSKTLIPSVLEDSGTINIGNGWEEDKNFCFRKIEFREITRPQVQKILPERAYWLQPIFSSLPLNSLK